MKVTIGHTFFSMAISRGGKLTTGIQWSLGFKNTYQDSFVAADNKKIGEITHNKQSVLLGFIIAKQHRVCFL